MPELPEVECVRRTLAPGLEGRTVLSAEVVRPKLAHPDAATLIRGVAGRRVEHVGRHGKTLWLELDSGAILALHLGMTGQLILAEQRPEADHIHISLALNNGWGLHYRDVRRFGRLTFCPDRRALEEGPLRNMGPDALLIGRREFARRLSGRGGRIKSLLLDQRITSGIGNIYADESLHKAGIHPEARPCDLPLEALETLYDHLHATLAESIRLGGSSVRNFVDAEGKPGTFQHQHRVYRRTGRQCPVCGQAVCRLVVGGRASHFCPDCQKS